MKKVEYDEHDGMPAEVATKLLLEPKAKLTARMRKNCEAARQRTITSPSPIRCEWSDSLGYETDEKQVRRDYISKCVKRFEQLTMTRLCQIRATATKRQAVICRLFEKYYSNQLRARLVDEAQRLDTILDVVGMEIFKRTQKNHLQP